MRSDLQTFRLITRELLRVAMGELSEQLNAFKYKNYLSRCMSDNELTDSTKSINQSGIFLQSFISRQLATNYWSVDVEYPVQVAPFIADPSKHKNYPSEGTERPMYHTQDVIRVIEECKNKMELEETSIDVVATTENGEAVYLCIECKKLDPAYSDWVFFDVSNPKTMNTITKNTQNTEDISLLDIPEILFPNDGIFIKLHKWETSTLRRSISNTSIALTNHKIDKKTYKSSKSLIDNATRQIIKGTYGFILERIQNDILHGLSRSYLETFIPIIVTTANLRKCLVNLEDIDSKFWTRDKRAHIRRNRFHHL